jgi:hypothetical protein
VRSIRSYLLFFILLSDLLFAQKVFQILKVGPGSFKKYELFCDDKLVYKLKGDHVYKSSKILNMNDSLILLSDDLIIKLSDIKAIKFKNGNHLMETMAEGSWKGAVLWPILNVVNNLILENSFRIDPRAIYISAGFWTAYIIFKTLSVKRVRVRDNVTLKVLDLNFQNLAK